MFDYTKFSTEQLHDLVNGYLDDCHSDARSEIRIQKSLQILAFVEWLQTNHEQTFTKVNKTESMKTALEIAKSHKNTRNTKRVSDELVELALAWANDEVTLSQVSAAIGLQKSGTTSYVMLARALKQHLSNK